VNAHDLVVIAAREFTPHELCFYANTARDSGQFHIEACFLDALALHAQACSWGDLIAESMLRKEEDVG